MKTLRLIVPAALVERLLALLRADDTVTNVLHLPVRRSIRNATSSMSVGARRAAREALGSPADAMLWEQVEQQVSESTDLSLNSSR